MRGSPSSSECAASACINPPTCPEEQQSVDSARYGTAGGFDESNNEEVGLFDVVLPRVASCKDAENPKGRTIPVHHACSVATSSRSSSSSCSPAEAAESRLSVRMADAENGENSERDLELGGKAESKPGARRENDARRDKIEQQTAYAEENKEFNENGSTCNVSVELNVTAQQMADLEHGIIRITDQRVIADPHYTGFPPLLGSTVHDAELQTELPLEVMNVNDSVNNLKRGEGATVPTVPSTTRGHLTAFVATGQGSTAGVRGKEPTSEHGAAATFRTMETPNAKSHVAVAAVRGNSDSTGQDTETTKLPQPAAGERRVPRDRQAEPCSTGSAAYTQGMNCCVGELGRTAVVGDAKSANPLRAKQTSRKETPKDGVWETEEQVEEPRRAEPGVGLGTEARCSSISETLSHAGSVGAAAVDGKAVESERRLRLAGIEKAHVLPMQCGVQAGESKSTSCVYVENPKYANVPRSSVSAPQSTEPPTSLHADGRGRTLVTSRRQLFERGPPAVKGEVRLRRILSNNKNFLPQDEEKAETAAAAAVRGSRTAGELSRKGSTVEMLREKYERRASGSTVCNARTQRPANTRALSEPFARGKDGKTEPTCRQKQRERLQATQKATGRTCAAVGEPHGSNKERFTFSAARDGAVERGGFERNGERDGGARASFSAVRLEKDGSKTTAEAANATDLQSECGRQPRTVITVHSGECSTVTSLKEKFERRTVASTPGVEQQQPQHRVQQLQRSAEGVKLLREQYERRRFSEDNKSVSSDRTAALTPVMTRRPIQTVLEKESDLCESSTTPQATRVDPTGPAALSPVQCLKEEYQRRVEAAATASPRNATPIPGINSTSVKSARELLGSIDIAGRYGKEYRIAKAERALKKEQSQSAGEVSHVRAADGCSGTFATVGPTVTALADEQARCSHTPSRYSCSKESLSDRQLGEKANAGRQSGSQSAKSERHRSLQSESFVSENSSVREVEHDLIKGYEPSAKREKEVPVDPSSRQSRSVVVEREAVNRSQGDDEPGVATTISAELPSHVGRARRGGAQKPAVSARASSKIGALASALGPAFSNFGKAPPPRLLTRAEPAEETGEIDPEIFGYSKAQEAIERRKRELRLLAKTGDSVTAEETGGCAEKTTGRASSSDEASKVCNLGSAEEHGHDSRAGVSGAMVASMSGQRAQPREVDSDEELGGSSVMERNLWNRGASGDTSELSCATNRIELSDTKGVLCLQVMEDESSNITWEQKLSRCTGEGRDSGSSPAGELRAAIDRGGMANAALDGCSCQSSHSNGKYLNESPGNGEAFDGKNGIHPWRSHGVAAEDNQSRGGCPRDVSVAGMNGKALSAFRRGRVEPPHNTHAEGHAVSATPAKAAASTRETEDVGVSALTAKHASVIRESNIDRGATVEGTGQKATPGGKSGTRSDEAQLAPVIKDAQMSPAKAIPSAEGQTPVSGGAPAKADDPNIVQGEEVELRNCCPGSIERRFHQKSARLGSCRTHRSCPDAGDEEKTEEVEMRDKQDDAVEGNEISGPVEVGEVVAPTRATHMAMEEQGGACRAVAAASELPRTSDDETVFQHADTDIADGGPKTL